MSLLTTPQSAPGEQDPLRQRPAKRSKEAREAAKQQRAAEAGNGGGRGKRGAPASTSVNLLSPWVLEELRVHHLRRKFLMGALALVVVLGLVAVAMRVHLGNVRQDLADEQANSDALQSQINGLADVKRYVGDVTLRTADVENAMSTDVTLSNVIRALNTALPEGASFESISITLPTTELLKDPNAAAADADPVCPGPDPFAVKEVVGCIELIGEALTRDDVSTMVQALAKSKLFVEPFVDDTSNVDQDAGRAVKYTMSAGLSPETLTNRYTDFDGSDAPADQPESDGDR